MKAQISSSLLAIAFSILATATSRAAPLHIDFLHEYQRAPLLRDSLRYKNAKKETLSVTRLAWLATDFTLITEGGKSISIPQSQLFVPTRGATISLPHATSERIQAIHFFVGPDKGINHSDPALYGANHALNPNFNNLHWDREGGYIFLAIEGHWRQATDKLQNGYAYHYARDSNRVEITLPIKLNLKNESRIAIALDVNKVLSGLSFAIDGATTHSAIGDPVSSTLQSNLKGSFRIADIKTGGVPTPPHPPKPIDLPAKPIGYPIRLPRHIPLPPFPSDNPIITSRVTLGEQLFHETKLSRDKSISCATCHLGKTFSDPRKLSPGINGTASPRHSMSLLNLAWKKSFFWDGRSPSLRKQALEPIQSHLEMDNSIDHVITQLKLDPTYPPLFAAAFGSGKISDETIGLAIEAFLFTRISLNSKLDQSLKGKATLTAEEQKGFNLFFTESEPRMRKRGADCFHCHGGALFTDHSFHNNGLTETTDTGLEKTTGKKSDRYKFSTPSLRNIALTPPYMHDGRFATLEEVIDHYNAPMKRSQTLDPNLAKHPHGLGLTDADKKALIAFLKTLTDPAVKN